MATTSCPSSFKVSGSQTGSKFRPTRRPRKPKPPPPNPSGHHQNSAIAREVGDEDLAEVLRDGNPGPLSPFEPFEIGGPLSARRDGEKGLGDETPVRDQGADEEFEEGQDGAVRNGLGQEGQPGAERGRDRGKHGA